MGVPARTHLRGETQVSKARPGPPTRSLQAAALFSIQQRFGGWSGLGECHESTGFLDSSICSAAVQGGSNEIYRSPCNCAVRLLAIGGSFAVDQLTYSGSTSQQWKFTSY